MATVPILSDGELSPEAAAVFADIRATRGSDFVNNIWRALANDPPLLKATWERVRDVMAPREGGLDDATATVTLDRADFDRLILQEASALGLVTTGKMRIQGNRGAVSAMFDALDQPDFWFNTVTP